MFKTDFDLMSVVEEGLAGIPAALISYAWALLAFVIIVALVYLIAGRGNRNISAHKAVGYAFPDTFYRHSSSRVDFLNALLQFGGAQKWFASLSQWPPCLVCNVAVTMLFMVAFPHSAVAGASPVVMTLSVDLSSQGAEIAPEVYGQFIEHTGNVIYDGIWVGEGSPIPNIRGIRKDVVAALKRLKVPMLRWPGGCFADQYDWRDGIGPRDKRPKRSVAFRPGLESNAFGTHEYMDFAELIGAEPYISLNIGSMTPLDSVRWLEYINDSNGSTLAAERQKNGRALPWNLKYVGLGNEIWGCGGNMRPETAADETRRYAFYIDSDVVRYSPQQIYKIASGPSYDFPGYEEFTEAMMKESVNIFGQTPFQALSLHSYPTQQSLRSQGSGGFEPLPSIGFAEEGRVGVRKNVLRID